MPTNRKQNGTNKNQNYNSMNYKPVIGLEVHVELKTKSKMFCECLANYFGQKPNTHTCPVCLGLPGALPVPNLKAIEWCVMIGQALNCQIPLFAKFDRKNYFYPDLPKGYQISQYDQPFCLSGNITLSNGKKIGVTRVHMEEDTGKLIHQGDSTLIDFNRSGVPLVEIVTEPDFESASEVREYLQKLQQIVRYLGVSDADMEKGEMRLEPNISLKETSSLPKYKVEVKNINSFKFVEKAIEYEIKRQTEILEQGKTPAQETRGWDENHNRTDSQRSKEEAHDYRYFPEPDIPPVRWTKSQITNLRSKIGELPSEKLKRFLKDYNLSLYDSEILTKNLSLANYFEEAVKIGRAYHINPKQIANHIINRKIDTEDVLPSGLIKIIAKSSQKTTVDENLLIEIIKKVLSENPKAVDDYKSGKKQVLMFLMGLVFRQIKEKVDPNQVSKILEKMLQ